MDKYMNLAIEEAIKSLKHDDIPVGAVVVKDGEIISSAHNEKEFKNDATKHAEIIAIEKACNKLNTWHLDDCMLITTMEPCMMCSGAIIQSRIKKIVFGVENEKYGFSKVLNEKYKIVCIKYNDVQLIIDLLKNFFASKR